MDNITELMLSDNRLIEVVTDNTLINVEVDPRIDIATITADDPDPKFVNVEVIRAGISATNNRRYNNSVVDEINSNIPGVQGFLGHEDPSKHGFEFREPQCIFVGSVVDIMPDGVHRSIAKAYLFKTSPLREWIPKSIASRNPMTVSINGRGDVIRTGEIMDVLRMHTLQSIDWANPGTEGMHTSQALTVVNELKNNKNGGTGMDNSVKEILSNTSITELKVYNPTIVGDIMKSMTITELQTSNPSLVKAIEDGAKITEMKLVLGGVESSVKVTELQGVISGLDGKIATLTSTINDMKISEFRTNKLAELVPENMREKIASRVTGADEQSIVSSIHAEIAYVREMADITNAPIGANIPKLADDVKSAVSGLFGNKEKAKV